LGITNKIKLHICSIPMQVFKPDKIRKTKLHHTKHLTILAFHPTKRTVAGSDVTGLILTWRCFGNSKFSESSVKLKEDEGRDGVRGDDESISDTTSAQG
jgi:NET1-associated nuclear protein 1 (U3 small nucleolar RNA-associated protein 17)